MTNDFFEDFEKTNEDSNNKIASSFEIQRRELTKEVQVIDRDIVNLEMVKANLILRRLQIEKSPIYTAHQEDHSVPVTFHSKYIIYETSSMYVINIPFRLPVYKKNIGKKYEYYHSLNYAYMIPLTQSLHPIVKKAGIKFEEAFVLITHYTKDEIILDTDNRFHSFIFNALRSTGAIVDDSHLKLSYMENGKLTEESDFVRVIVTHEKDMLAALNYNQKYRNI